MDAGQLNIGKVFGQDRRYIVPLFQRPYVWNREKQWEPLWEDVRKVAERLMSNQPVRPHFLGAIVLDQVRHPTGHTEMRTVIDGQQRLTTIQLILEAFCDFCEVAGLEKHHKAMLKLSRNDDPLSESDDEKFKVWPTNVDREHYRRVMEAHNPEQLCKEYGCKKLVDAVGHPIADGYLFFYSAVSAWVGSDGQVDSRVEALYKTVREYLRVVVIDLDDRDDAQLIFETMNARGTPLLPSDLVKNFLFHRAQQEGDQAEQIYEKLWRPFDDAAHYWRKELGRGHAQRARIDSFLQHYLTVMLCDEVGVSHLYSAFRDFLTAPKTGKAREVLASIRQYAQVFQRFDDTTSPTRVSLFFQRLQVMDISTAYPFLMEVFVKLGDDDPATVQILVDLESFLVRRMICQLNTRGYGSLFVDLLKAVSKGNDPARQVRDFLLSSDAESTRWPDDEELRGAWIDYPIYRGLIKPRVRMILEGLELQLHHKKSELLQFGEKLTIEHLMPRKWRKHWPMSDLDGEKAEARRDRVLHTMGNLTLINKRLNPAISNGPWDKKRKEILKYSALNLNRQLDENPTWDEDCIEGRGATLFKEAVRIWPRPKGPAA